MIQRQLACTHEDASLVKKLYIPELNNTSNESHAHILEYASVCKAYKSHIINQNSASTSAHEKLYDHI